MCFEHIIERGDLQLRLDNRLDLSVKLGRDGSGESEVTRLADCVVGCGAGESEAGEDCSGPEDGRHDVCCCYCLA
jgi:hypothetical protein